MKRLQIPNGWVPLSIEERIVQQSPLNPWRLMELAEATGNWPLYRVARDLAHAGKRKRRR